MYYRDDIERLCKNLRERASSLREELKDLPEGEFYSREDAGRRKYYQRLRKEGNRKKERRNGIKGDRALLNALIRKKYVIEALLRLDENISAADNLLKFYMPTDENSVMKDFTSKYPELSEGIYSGAADLLAWAAAYKPESDFYLDGLTSTASDGTKRRSKGEILIGAKLDHYNIPYRYEAEVHPDIRWVPDFTIRRPRDGKFIYWEHLGKVSDKEYMDHNRTKLADYEGIGIVPWDNLIITYDQADGGINEKIIDAMIHGWLL